MDDGSKMFDVGMFSEIFKDISTPTGIVTEKFDQIVGNGVTACDASMSRSRNNAHRLPKLWWNDKMSMKLHRERQGAKLVSSGSYEMRSVKLNGIIEW